MGSHESEVCITLPHDFRNTSRVPIDHQYSVPMLEHGIEAAIMALDDETCPAETREALIYSLGVAAHLRTRYEAVCNRESHHIHLEQLCRYRRALLKWINGGPASIFCYYIVLHDLRRDLSTIMRRERSVMRRSEQWDLAGHVKRFAMCQALLMVLFVAKPIGDAKHAQMALDRLLSEFSASAAQNVLQMPAH